MTCVPNSNSTTECGFSNYETKFFTEPHEKWVELLAEGKTPFSKIDINDEFLDYLEEFPVIELKKGTVICHSSENFYIRCDSPDKFDNSVLWWNKYFPGQTEYKGGWFSFETTFGSPKFNNAFYYKLQKNLQLLFIPPIYKDLFYQKNKSYFSNEVLDQDVLIKVIEKDLNEIERDLINSNFNPKKIRKQFSLFEKFNFKSKLLKKILNENIKIEDFNNILILYSELAFEILQTNDEIQFYSKFYSGSHLIQGVKNWQEKGYQEIIHPKNSYADFLAKKIAQLGFNGYVSCDECEIYITHCAMKNVLKRPFLIRKRFSENSNKNEKELFEKYNKKFYVEIPLKITNQKIRPIFSEMGKDCKDVKIVLNDPYFSLD